MKTGKEKTAAGAGKKPAAGASDRKALKTFKTRLKKRELPILPPPKHTK